MGFIKIQLIRPVSRVIRIVLSVQVLLRFLARLVIILIYYIHLQLLVMKPVQYKPIQIILFVMIAKQDANYVIKVLSQIAHTVMIKNLV